MKPFLGILAGAFICSQVFAGMIELSPNPKDMQDLSHSDVYVWEINASTFDNMDLTGLTLYIDNLNNTEEPEDGDALFIHILDGRPNAPLGWVNMGNNAYSSTYKAKDPNLNVVDYFSGAPITVYSDASSTPENYSYKFSAEDVEMFKSYIDNGGVVALGFDPDCHFTNTKIRLQAVPEPAIVSLIGFSLLALCGASSIRRRK